MSRNKIVPVVVLAAAVLAAGCAQQGTKAEEEPHSTAVYRLGSRIPVGRENEVQHRPRTDVEEKMHKFAEELYRNAGAQKGGAQGGEHCGACEDEAPKGKSKKGGADGDVIDADFKEVKDK